MILYGFKYSGNSYRVKLFLSLLGLSPIEQEVNLATGENRTSHFLHINPLGQVPVLLDGPRRILDSHAILVYLARQYDTTQQWLPSDPYEHALVMQWMFLDANEIHNGVGYARNHVTFGFRTDLKMAQARGQKALSAMERRFEGCRWLELDRPTLADVSCYPLVALADEAGLDTKRFPGIESWLERMKQLPGYVAMDRVRRLRVGGPARRAEGD